MFAKNALKEFYTMPTSTTGKYHQPLALGEGGLVRHTLTLLLG